MKEPSFVVVLILSYNGKELLHDAIGSYLANDYENFKIVVIDNGSSDGTQGFVEDHYPQATLLRLDENQGYSGGFNVGLAYAFNDLSANFVLVTNNDVKVDPGIISALVRTAKSDEKTAFTIGKTYFFEQPELLQSVGKMHDPKLWSNGHIGGHERDEGQFEEPAIREWCDDIYWLISADIYRQTGGYDTEFAFQAEDFEWQIRAKKLGYHIKYTPEARLWHKDSVTIGKNSPFKIYFDFRNPLIAHMKHREYEDFQYFFKNKRRYLLLIIYRNLKKLRLYYVHRSIRGFLSALRWGLKHRKISFFQIFK